MKKQTVFIDLKGYLINYLEFIFTETKTRDVSIQSLKAQLNVIIREVKEQGMLATAKNCEQVWKQLTATVKEAKIQNDSDPCYKEIVEAVDNIGKEIAYIGKRKGLDINTLAEGYVPFECEEYAKKNIYQALTYCLLKYTNDKDTLEITKRQLLLMFHDGMLTEENSNYHLMTDEDLINVGNAFREAQRAKGYKIYEEVKKEEKPVTFKATGTEDIKFFND